MPGTAANIVEGQTQRWVFEVASFQLRHLRRGLPLAGAANGEAIVERVSNAAQLDAGMRQQLARILTVTVRDWMRK